MGERGWFGIPIPREYGGLGGDYLSYTLAVQELARVDASHSITVSAHTTLGTSPIFYFGTEEQKQRWLPDVFEGFQVDPDDVVAYRVPQDMHVQVDASAFEPDPREEEALECLLGRTARQRARGLALLADLGSPDLFDWCVMFLGDDAVFGPRSSERLRMGLPTEGLLLHMLAGGDAMLMCVWPERSRPADVLMTGTAPNRRLGGCEVRCEAGRPIWVALLEGASLWHTQAIPAGGASEPEAHGEVRPEPVDSEYPLLGR